LKYLRKVLPLTVSLLLTPLFLGQQQTVFAEFDCNTVSEIPISECEALVSLYNSTNGESWSNNDGWLISDTPCGWHGIICSGGHVTWPNLKDNQLTGSIPIELSSLTNLLWLYIQDNQLTGNIPVGLMNLTSLSDLNICNNHLYTTNSDLRDFLSSLQSDWEKCQKRHITQILLLLLGE